MAEVVKGLQPQQCPADPVARLVALCQQAMRAKVKDEEEQAALEALQEPVRTAIAEFAHRQALPVSRLASEAAAMLREVPPDRFIAAIDRADRAGWEAWRQVKLAVRNGANSGPNQVQNQVHPDLARLREAFSERYRAIGMLLPWDSSRDDARASQLLRWLSDGGVQDPVDILRRALRKYLSLDDRAAAAGHPLPWFWARAEHYVNLVLREDYERRVNQIPTVNGKPMW